MISRFLAAAAIFVLTAGAAAARAEEKVRVAVVGDSISKIRSAYGGRGWPTELGELLGKGYDVRTFSANGVTCLRIPSRSVWSRAEIKHAAEFQPNIVIILMGANMGKAGHWVHKNRYAGDYRALIAHFRSLPTKPKVYLCKPIPVHEDNFGIDGRIVKDGVAPIIERIAKEDGLPLIDTYTPLADKPDTTSDGIHPTRRGHELIARAVRAALTGKADPALAARKDSLRLPSILACRMVLQQNAPVPVWGWAKAGTKVTVKVAGREKSAVAGADGRWKVSLPAMKPGGPHTITLTTDKDARPISLKDVFVGEVWLFAGGADVASRIKKNPGGMDVWRQMANVKMSLFNMPSGVSDTPRDHVRTTWRPWDRWRAWERSAMGYYFGDELQKKLNVPVGVIVASRAGAPIRTWMPPQGPATGAGVYNAMIHPAVGFPIRGVVWCQGKSDAKAAGADDQIPSLIESWRKAWGQGNIAFHHVGRRGGSLSRPDAAKQAAFQALAQTYGRKDLPPVLAKTDKPPKPKDTPKPQAQAGEGEPSVDAPVKVELKVADVINPKGDGPDGKGNTADDTWQFWFELAHQPGTYRQLSLATAAMSAEQRQRGIPRKVTGPVGARLPNPKDTEGWIFHRDWDGRFEGVWGDKKTGHVILYPYVEKNYHGCVALTYTVPAAGTYTIAGKITDLQVKPGFARHDGVFWIVEKTHEGARGRQLGKGGPIGDGHGRPDSAEFQIEKASLEKGQLIRLVIHPNKWWGTDMTRIDYLRIERTAGAAEGGDRK